MEYKFSLGGNWDIISLSKFFIFIITNILFHLKVITIFDTIMLPGYTLLMTLFS